jgi:hypothetical protein
MHIINIVEIENMVERLQPQLDGSTLISIEDEDLSKVIKYWGLLEDIENHRI